MPPNQSASFHRLVKASTSPRFRWRMNLSVQAGEMELHVEALRGFALLSIIDRHPFYGPQRSGEVERVARMPLLGETQIV